jgi:L-lactate permease
VPFSRALPASDTRGRDGAILIGLGFSPLAASGLSLIANTARGLWRPGHVITLAKVHGYDLMEVTAMIGRQLLSSRCWCRSG